MDSDNNINQDPLATSDNGATSFASDFDMSAINEAVAAGGDANNIQNSFDVNDINLSNTPTTDTDLAQQLAENPNMSLANSEQVTTESQTPTAPAASFVDGDLSDETTDMPSGLNEEMGQSSISADSTSFESTPADLGSDFSDSAEKPANNTEAVESKEPATVADLANEAQFDSSATSQAPEATPPGDIAPEQAPIAPITTVKGGKSKTSVFVLAGLLVVAVIAVAIIVVMNMK